MQCGTLLYATKHRKNVDVIEGWVHAKVPVAEMAGVLKRHKVPRSFGEIKRNFPGLMIAFPRNLLDTSAWRHQITQRRRVTHNATDPAP